MSEHKTAAKASEYVRQYLTKSITQRISKQRTVEEEQYLTVNAQHHGDHSAKQLSSVL